MRGCHPAKDISYERDIKKKENLSTWDYANPWWQTQNNVYFEITLLFECFTDRCMDYIPMLLTCLQLSKHCMLPLSCNKKPLFPLRCEDLIRFKIFLFLVLSLLYHLLLIAPHDIAMIVNLLLEIRLEEGWDWALDRIEPTKKIVSWSKFRPEGFDPG